MNKIYRVMGGMTLCQRFLFCTSPFSHQRLQVVANPTLISWNYPCKFQKFTNQPLLCKRSHTAISSSSSMESPPEGYRRNVGVCLINPSKKVYLLLMLFVHVCICMWNLLLIWFDFADICCFKAWYTWCMANAAGDLE